MLGTGGFVVFMLIATISFLAWLPAIAAVVLSEKPFAQRLSLFLTLALFPPFSLAIMAASIRKGRHE